MKSFFKFLACGFALVGAGFLTPSHAAVVTFDDAAGNTALFDQNIPSYSSGGLTFTPAPSSIGVWGIWNGSPNGNTTNELIFSGSPNTFLTISRTGGGLFDLASIDLSISWYNNALSDTIDVNGNSISLVQGQQNYVLGLVGVSSVTLSGFTSASTAGGYWLMDNVNFSLGDTNGVPEPGSLALVGLALVGLASARRKPAKV